MKLIKLADDKFRMTAEAVTIEGTLAVVSRAMEEQYNMDPEQIADALDDMELTGNDAAEFGVYGDFLFTYSERQSHWVRLEIRAVLRAREEFHRLYKTQGCNSVETYEAAQRLQSLYIALNLDQALELIEGKAKAA